MAVATPLLVSESSFDMAYLHNAGAVSELSGNCCNRSHQVVHRWRLMSRVRQNGPWRSRGLLTLPRSRKGGGGSAGYPRAAKTSVAALRICGDELFFQRWDGARRNSCRLAFLSLNGSRSDRHACRWRSPRLGPMSWLHIALDPGVEIPASFTPFSNDPYSLFFGSYPSLR